MKRNNIMVEYKGPNILTTGMQIMSFILNLPILQYQNFCFGGNNLQVYKFLPSFSRQILWQ